MGYRHLEQPHKPPMRVMQDTSVKHQVYVQNGATANLAIPCWYVEIVKPKRAYYHDRPTHDHRGWPEPFHPDHSCQAYDFAHACNVHSCGAYDPKHHDRGRCKDYLDPQRVFPIHLGEEGYTDISVVLDDAPLGIEAHGTIDQKEDWVVRVLFDVKCNDAIDEKVVIPFTVFANGDIDGRKVRDVVGLGKLIVLPGPYERVGK